MPISQKQRQIMAFPFTRFDALIADGAIRSGKTSFMMLAFVDDAMRRYNGQRFAICGKTVDSTVKNIVVPYLGVNWAQDKYNLSWRRADKVLLVSDGKHQNIFEVFGGKDESSFSLIQGRTLAGVLFDEVALQPRSFVEQALARCSVEGSRFWFNCNPESPKHWFYEEWVKNPKKHNALHLHFELDDNPALTEEIKARYRSMYSGVFYDRYILGKWVAAEGVVYRDFADNPDRYLIDDVDNYLAKTNQRPSLLMIGVDFGGNASATTFKAVVITSRFKEVIVADECYIKEQINPQQLNERFSDFAQTVTAKWGGAQVRADSAEQILIRGLNFQARKDKLKAEIKNSIKLEINNRIRLENILMAQDRLKVCKKCKQMIEAFRYAVYDPKKLDHDERLDDGTSDIDSLDAFEYAIEPYYNELTKAGFTRR